MKLQISEAQLQQCGMSMEQLAELFRTQMKKDLEMCGIIMEEEVRNLHFDEWVNYLAAKISALSEGRLLELFYRIDVPEERLKKETLNRPKESVHKIRSELIIRRILQKIILKLIYTDRKK